MLRVHDSTISLADGRIYAPHENISDDVFCNKYLKTFYASNSIRRAYGESIYYRWTNLENEIDLAMKREINPSQNHLHQKQEKGLSVAEGPWRYFAKHRFCYFVSGAVLDCGSDAEPILDIKTICVHGPLIKRNEILNDFYNSNRATISEIALSARLDELEIFKFLLGVV